MEPSEKKNIMEQIERELAQLDEILKVNRTDFTRNYNKAHFVCYLDDSVEIHTDYHGKHGGKQNRAAFNQRDQVVDGKVKNLLKTLFPNDEDPHISVVPKTEFEESVYNSDTLRVSYNFGSY